MHNDKPARRSRASDIRTVLLVDDYDDLRRMFRRYLALKTSLRVLEAASALGALTILEAEPIDVVVSDLTMPGLDGLELLAEVGRRWPRTRRLLVTAHSTGEMVATLEYGVMHKLISAQLIVNEIARLAREDP